MYSIKSNFQLIVEGNNLIDANKNFVALILVKEFFKLL